MLSVIIPTKNAADTLPALLDSLKPAQEAGIVTEILASDANSTDDTLKILNDRGIKPLTGVEGRGFQMVRAAAAAQGPWLLFLRQGAEMSFGWADTVKETVGRNRQSVGYFRLRFSEPGHGLFEFWIGLRASLFKLPLADQGLLISKSYYGEIGGFRPDFPDLEDADLIRRVDKGRLVELAADVVIDATSFAERGWFDAMLDDIGLTATLALGKKPIEVLKSRHEQKKRKERAEAAAERKRAAQE